MTTRTLIEMIEQAGERLVIEDDKLVVIPGTIIDDELFDLLRQNRDAVANEVKLGQLAGQYRSIQRGSEYDKIRELCPAIGQWATFKNGWTGRVFGVSLHGVAARGIHNLVFPFSAEDLVNLSRERPRL